MTSDARSLDAKSIVVTGASQGLGRAYAQTLSVLGARLVLADVDAAGLAQVAGAIRAAGGEVEVVTADVCDADAMAAVAARAAELHGGLDGWVNNAGIIGYGRVDLIDPGLARQILEVNVLGTMHGIRAAAGIMREQGSGSIVNTTSGQQSGIEVDSSAYGASKGAVSSLTYGAALDLAPLSIRVNAVSPMAATGMVDAHDLHLGAASGPPLPSLEDNAAVVAYLLSDASSGVTGEIVRIDARGVSRMTRPGILDGATTTVAAPTLDYLARMFEHSGLRVFPGTYETPFPDYLRQQE